MIETECDMLDRCNGIENEGKERKEKGSKGKERKGREG